MSGKGSQNVTLYLQFQPATYGIEPSTKLAAK
jgi:hypothetical protein